MHGDRRADRSAPMRRSAAPSTSCSARRRRAASGCPRPTAASRLSGYIVLGHGQARRRRAQLFERHRSHRLLRARASRRCADGVEPQPFFVRLTRDLVRLMQERTGDGYVFRTDLRLRPDAGATQIALSTDGGAHLLRELRPELGARGAHQGARRAPATSPRARRCSASWRRSSGASISTSRRSPTSTR